jgi:hypothetical protein
MLSMRVMNSLKRKRDRIDSGEMVAEPVAKYGYRLAADRKSLVANDEEQAIILMILG